MPALKYNPPLSEIVSIKEFPEFLSFIKDGLESVIENSFYKNFQYSKNEFGSNAFYSLDLLIKQRLAIELPGTGIYLILNPDYENGTSSLFPITVDWEWPILKFLRYIKVTNFSFTLEDIYYLVIEILEIEESQIIELAIRALVEPGDNDTSEFNQLVNDINILYDADITIDESSVTRIEELIAEINELNKSAFIVIFSLYLISPDITVFKEKLNFLMSAFIPNDVETYLRNIFTPKIRTSLLISAAIEFPRNILTPVFDENGENPYDSQTGDPYTVIQEDSNGFPKVLLNFGEALFYADTELGIGSNIELTLSTNYPALIGKTGFIIDIETIKLDLSTKTNLFEADEDGRPSDFIGCFITEASILFPAKWQHDPEDTDNTAEIKARNLLIGTGGISGTISMEAKDPESSNPSLVKVKLGAGFEIGLASFAISFQQNAVISSEINGTLKIPGLKQVDGAGYKDALIDIKAYIGANGNFSISASTDTAIEALTIPGVLKIKVKEIGYAEIGDRSCFHISGSLQILTTSLPGLDGIPDIEIKKLTIWDNGKMEIEGGVLPLPKAFKLKVGPVALSVTSIGFGSHEQYHVDATTQVGQIRQYKYFGFSGSLNTGPGGVTVQGDGVRFYYTIDDDNANKGPHRFLRIEGIGVEIKIPGDATAEEADTLISGYLSMKNAPAPSSTADNAPNPQREFLGSVKLRLNKPKLTGSVAMRLNPDEPSFIVDASIELENGIKLGTTGLEIVGFRGLIGKKYIVDKGEEEDWWAFYKKPELGTDLKKFKQGEGFTLGAGVSLQTLDKGKAMSAKVFFMLSNNYFMLQGQAAFLKGPQNLSDPADPPFSALLVIDKNAIKATLGIDYPMPDKGNTGAIAQIHGKAEMAFFFKNASGWYINIGKDTPKTERISAKVFNLFDSKLYMMINKAGLRTGAYSEYSFQQNYLGIVEFGLSAYLDINARISFRPVQIGASIALGGYAYASVLRFKFGLTVTAGLAAEAFKPFMILGNFGVSLDVPKPFKNKSFDVEFKWFFDKDPDTLPFELMPLTKAEMIPAKATHMLTQETFNLNFAKSSTQLDIPSAIDPENDHWDKDFDECVIPMDSFIDISFDASLANRTVFDSPIYGDLFIDGNLDPTEDSEMVPPQRGYSDQVKHKMSITNFKIKYWDEADGWQKYYPYEAMSSVYDIPEVQDMLASHPTFLKELPVVFWQASAPGKKSTLRVLAKSALSYLSHELPGTFKLEYLGYGDSFLKCEQDALGELVINWENVPVNYEFDKDTKISYQNVFIMPRGKVATVKEQSNDFDKNNGLKLLAPEGIEINFPDPVTKIGPKLSSENNVIVFSYYKKDSTENDINNLPVYKYTLVLEEKVEADDLATYEGYNDAENPVDKMVISIMPEPPSASLLDGDLYLGVNWWMEGPYPYIQAGSPYVLDEFCFFEKALSLSEIKDWKSNGNVPANPLVRYDFNENLLDSSSNGYDATPASLGATTYSTDRANQIKKALRVNFYANLNSIISVPHDDRLSLDVGNFSIGFWFNISSQISDITDHIFPIFSKMGGNGPDYYFHNLLFKTGVDADNLHYLDFIYYRNSEFDTIYSYSYPNNLTPDAKWHHVALVGDRENKILSVYFDGNKLNEVEIELKDGAPTENVCEAYIHEITYVDKRISDFNIKIPGQDQIDSEIQRMQDGLNNTIQAVWRPDTKFAIQMTTVDSVNGTDHAQNYYFGFKTAGPVGHFHQTQDVYADLLEADREDEYKLANLRHYIDYERSTPAANGNLLLSKPIFYTAPKLKLFFISPFAYGLYSDWDSIGNHKDAIGSKLKLTVKDALDDLDVNRRDGDWVQRNNQTQILEDDKMIIRLAKSGINCSSLPTEITKISFMSEYALPDLEPNKLYTAIYYAVYNSGTEASQQVHNHVFSTSRYASFAEQINSYLIYNEDSIEKYALYNLIKDFSTSISDGIDVFTDDAGTDPELISKFADRFDRLMDGVLKIGTLNNAIGTEVNVVFDSDSEKILGLLVRNPEPFIDPRIPLQTLDSSDLPISMSNDFDSSTYPLLYSKDRTAAFISNVGLDIHEGNVTLVFQNIQFNEGIYQSEGDSVSIEFALTKPTI